MSEERLYTLADAVVLGRRALCEASEGGHKIGLQEVYRLRNMNGIRLAATYGCERCDVTVELSYPPLAGEGLDTRC